MNPIAVDGPFLADLNVDTINLYMVLLFAMCFVEYFCLTLLPAQITLALLCNSDTSYGSWQQPNPQKCVRSTTNTAYSPTSSDSV
jgi:hypothetical protein